MDYNAKTNWQFDETVTENDLNRIEQGIKDVYESCMTKQPPVPIFLQPGPQVIESDVVAPLTGLQIKGRSLLNLLGRDGNCEDLSVWGIFQVSQALDSKNKSIGNNAIKLTLSTGFTSGSTSTVGARTFSFKAGKYYIAIADIKNGNATNGNFYINGTTAAKGQHIITATDKFNPAWRAYNPAADVSGLSMVLGINGAAGQYAYFDGVRIYEITQSDYNALDTMTPEQIAAKWPYVDDMKSVYSPYIIRNGENMLPPYAEWGTRNTAMTIAAPYSAGVSGKTVGTTYSQIIEIPVVDGQTYTFTVPVTIANIGGTIGFGAFYNLEPWDAKGNKLPNLDSAPYATANGTTVLQKTITIPANVVKLVIVFGIDTGVTGDFTFSNPTLNVGSEARPFKPRNDDHLFFPNVQLASNVDGTIRDTLFQRDGKYWKQARFRTMELTGDFKWTILGNGPGWRSVTTDANTVVGAQLVSNFGLCTFTKFDGKVLGPYSITSGLDTGWIPTDYSVRVGVPNIDSGWSDSYTNLSEDEIKAYFYGWQLLQTNGQPWNGGNPIDKRWFARWSPGAIWDPITDNVYTKREIPKGPAPGFTPYKLQYQLAAATVEEISSEGGITMHEGVNKFEVGTGMIVKERANPQLITGNYWINGGTTASKLKYRPIKMLSIAANGKETISSWTRFVPSETAEYGLMNASINQSNFDPAAAYTVSYLALDQYALSCNLLSLEAAHPTNMKSVVDTLAAGHADMAARVGALEITRAQRVQPQWIAPTLLNGWVNANYGNDAPVQYMKDSSGLVHIVGLAKDGEIGKEMFILPLGYRPSKTLTFVTVSNNGTSEILSRVWIRPTGEVVPASGSGAVWYSMSIPHFLGEQ
ncbi:hypothetical protein NLX71_10140 [Paenibacillus sp. MZ04-78.2]|uniref:hypothetical protein n=1 Tax=Paenibacillus sp. MZ04-78.2 TaxID=2962034 RepID=UPI0020B7D191|nr:hypothetical protein [Paenibacillus sp. MZ04-78.2]MCP3773669.1 hypothetical protein [Paenibacillus sp. MZ04-78.2]